MRRVRAIHAEKGVAGLTVRTLQRTVPRRLFWMEWFSLFESVPRPDAAPLQEAYPDAHWARPEEAERIGDLLNGTAVVSARLARGDLAAVVEQEDRPVGYLFLRRGVYEEADVVFHLDDDEWWLYDGYTVPEARGARIYTKLLDAAVDDAGRQGARRVISAIDHLNRASRRAAERHGAFEFGDVVSIRVPGVRMSALRVRGGRRAWAVHRGMRNARVPSLESSESLQDVCGDPRRG